MTPVAVAAAGATFVGTVVAGFVVGLLAARATGASWWVIVGIFAGIVLGIAEVALFLRRALQ